VFAGDDHATVYYLPDTTGWGTTYGGLPTAVWHLSVPWVSTLPATGVSTNSATLNGTVNPNGWPTTAWFQWGANTNYGNLTSVIDLGSGTTALPLSVPLAGLNPNVTYHFRIAATNDYGLAYGSDQSLTSRSLPTDFTYTITNGTITITGYTGPGGVVSIPGTINGLPVTSIGHWAFGWCTSLTSVTIPNSVTSIGAAFENCTSLTSVTIPGSVTNIGDAAFLWCTGLTNVTISNGVTSIGITAFSRCTSLTSITLPGTVAYIGLEAFSLCPSLTAITVGAPNPFYSSLDGVLLNKSQTTLIECPGAKAGSYAIPNSVTSIAERAFEECTGLTNVAIPNSVLSIGDYAFVFCYGLTRITMSSSLTSIGVGAFHECPSLTSLTIPSSVTDIGDSAFYDCSSLASVYFEGNAPSVGPNLFPGAGHVTVYYLPGTTGWGATFSGRPTALWIQVPTIQTPPQTQTAEAGSAVDLRADASSPLPLFYLWYLNNTNLISCSTNGGLALTGVRFSQSGAYTVVISNVLGAITSAPALLNVIAPVERRPVPGVHVTGEAGSLLNVDYADDLSPAPNWTPLGAVSLTTTSQYYFDLTLPLPPERFYRAWQTGAPGVLPSLDLHLVPAITVTGSIGGSVRVDAINQFGPTDAWFTLDTVTLTNTPQLYFDTSAPGQPQRLYRLVQVP
jgi:hypothetical protein